MARNASGTYSLPAGQPVVSGTVISAATENALTGDLATEITNSLSRDGYGGMRAALKNVNGTVTAPAVAFNNDANSGLYLNAVGDVRLSVAQNDRAWFTSAVNAQKSPAADVGTAYTFDTKNALANAASKLAGWLNNGVEKITFWASGLIYSALGFDGPTVQTSATNGSLTLKGNRAGADAGSDVVVNSSAARSAGALLEIQNNGTSAATVDTAGSVHGVNQSQYAYLTADKTTTSNVMADVAGMSFAVAANADYEWEALIPINAVTGMASAPTFTWSGPAAPTLVAFGSVGAQAGSTASSYATSFGSAITSAFTVNTTVWAMFRGILRNGANAGTVQLRYASGTDTYALTYKQGAYLRWRRMDSGGYA
ncbi:MAG TPA: hypothetical protein VF777_01425 [Phycisphaerales bacterium]